MDCEILKAWRPSRPHLTVSLKTFYHQLPLDLVLSEVTEELFLIRIILADPVKASLHEAKAVESLPRQEP